MTNVVDLQFEILELLHAAPRDLYGHPSTLPNLATRFHASWDEVIDTLKLLTKRRLVRMERWALTRSATFVPVEYRPGIDDIHQFVGGPDFRLFMTEDGSERLVLLRREREAAALPKVGDATADEVVRARVEELLQGHRMSPERRQILGRLLAQLVSIGVHSYRDAEFLVKPAFEALDSRPDRSKFERSFYQRFLHRELTHDDVLAPHLTKNPEQAGGLCDLLCMSDIAIEAKVVYPDETAAHAASVGIGQATQYAARSGLAFLVVLDMRHRADAASLGQIANDVRVISKEKHDGPTPVRIARVQHVAGHGQPSRARP